MSAKPMPLNIRPAEAQDTGLILGFIKELAAYEKLSHEVVASEPALAQSLFGEHRYAEVIIAEWQNEAVGFALFFHNYSTFLAQPGIYLEDLYVKPDFRGRGIGQALLHYLARLAITRGCGRLEWWVLNWNEDAMRFYRALKAQAMNEWTVFRLSGTELKQLAGH